MPASPVTTFGIREFKARISEIISELDAGSEVLITRRGKPCARLLPVRKLTGTKPSLASLRGTLADLPDATYEDFQDIKAIWESGPPAPGASERR